MPNNPTIEEQQKPPSTPTGPCEDIESNGEINEEQSAKEGLYENHPLRPLFGKYKDDPTWDEFMENIRQYRKEVDEMTKEQE
jgi:hypothetical protein